MSIAVLAAVLLWAVAFGATRAEAAVGDLRILGGERTIREGETVKRNISVMGGELEVRKDAKIYGDITIFGGEAEFDRGRKFSERSAFMAARLPLRERFQKISSSLAARFT